MSSPASIAKHPIHPMLIVFPIGLWVFSLACDIIYRAVGGQVWVDVAFYCMAGGIVGALVAAVPGFIDLWAMGKCRAKQIGVVHMSLNLLVTVLFVVDLFIRVSNRSAGLPPASSAFILSIVSVILLVASGWLGGEMVYVEGVAVEPQHDTVQQQMDKDRISKTAA